MPIKIDTMLIFSKKITPISIW